jgi:hypothetical protein
MAYLYFPSSYTKEAWDNRLYSDQRSLDDVITVLKPNYFISGRVLFRTKNILPLSFNSSRHLELLIKELSETEKESIARIFIYHVGFFSNAKRLSV